MDRPTMASKMLRRSWLKLTDMTTGDTAVRPMWNKTSNVGVFGPEGSSPVFKGQEFLDY